MTLPVKKNAGRPNRQAQRERGGKGDVPKRDKIKLSSHILDWAQKGYADPLDAEKKEGILR